VCRDSFPHAPVTPSQNWAVYPKSGGQSADGLRLIFLINEISCPIHECTPHLYLPFGLCRADKRETQTGPERASFHVTNIHYPSPISRWRTCKRLKTCEYGENQLCKERIGHPVSGYLERSPFTSARIRE